MSLEKKIDINVIHEIIAVAKRMDDKNLVNTYEGNISIKKDGLIYITPTQKSKASYTDNMIAVIDEDGNQVGGDFKPSSEFPMHSHVYLMREGINAIIHCHSPYLTAYAICNKPLTSKAYPEMLGLLKDVPVAAYGKPGTDEIYQDVKPLIQDRNLVLLANHGVLCVGPNLFTTLNRMEAAEAIAKVLTLANTVGTPADLPDSEIARFSKK